MKHLPVLHFAKTLFAAKENNQALVFYYRQLLTAYSMQPLKLL